MKYSIRPYQHQYDYERVNDFLIRHFGPPERPFLWLQPRWEYMQFHPLIWDTDLGKMGVAEVGGQIAGVVHHEHDEGVIYFQVPRPNAALTEPLLDYAEATYGVHDEETGQRGLTIFVHEDDHVLQALAAGRGYVQSEGYREVMSRLDLRAGVPEPALPDGFRLQSLADENDLRKVNQILWRGFNHEGPPPEEHIAGRKFMQSAPNFRPDLTIVAVAPNGDYVSFCGIWPVLQSGYSMVEPVASDPAYRRMGLGKAAVLEAIRRAAALGVDVAWVGSNQLFYQALGFEKIYEYPAWSNRKRPGFARLETA